MTVNVTFTATCDAGGNVAAHYAGNEHLTGNDYIFYRVASGTSGGKTYAGRMWAVNREIKGQGSWRHSGHETMQLTIAHDGPPTHEVEFDMWLVGAAHGGANGNGGDVVHKKIKLAPGTYTVQIGIGGNGPAGDVGPGPRPSAGGDSTAFGFTAAGGKAAGSKNGAGAGTFNIFPDASATATWRNRLLGLTNAAAPAYGNAPAANTAGGGGALYLVWDTTQAPTPPPAPVPFSSVNVGGAWKELVQPDATHAPAYVNVAGAWKPVSEAYVNVAGVWKKLWP